jgi:hypothetical protein
MQFEELGCGVKVVIELVVRLISMGRGSKSIRRWRKDRKRKKAEREKRKLAAADPSFPRRRLNASCFSGLGSVVEDAA